MSNAELIRRYDNLRSMAQNLQRKFRNRGDHYEFTGGMNDVEMLRDAIDEVEGYMIENNIPVPQP